MGRSSTCRVPCDLCGKVINTNGFAQINHKRMHVRRGELVEQRLDWVYAGHPTFSLRHVRPEKEHTGFGWYTVKIPERRKKSKTGP